MYWEISSQAPNRGRLNDYRKSSHKRGEAVGATVLDGGNDIVCSPWKHGAVEQTVQKLASLHEQKVKRSAVNWGIARELYTAPIIFVQLNEKEFSTTGGKVKARPSFVLKVAEIEVNEKREVTYLVVKDKFGNVRFTSGKKGVNKAAIIDADDAEPDEDSVDEEVKPVAAKRAKATAAKKARPDPEPEPEDNTEEDQGADAVGLKKAIDKVHEDILSLTSGLSTEEKVEWAKKIIVPVLGTMNYRKSKDAQAIKKLQKSVDNEKKNQQESASISSDEQ